MNPNSLEILTLNTCGMPFLSSHPSERLRLIAQAAEKERVNVINLQEVHTYHFLQILKKRLPSFSQVAYVPSYLGPKGGLVSFSKLPLRRKAFVTYKSGRKIKASIRSLFDVTVKGALVTELTSLPVTVINTHLTANRDNDWSPTNRYYSTHQAELAQLSRLVISLTDSQKTLIVTGDFNIAKDSSLYTPFLRSVGLKDAFAGDFTPTYQSGFLPPGRSPHCIDYILYTARPKLIIKQTGKLFQGKVKLHTGKPIYLSDHVGLRATLIL